MSSGFSFFFLGLALYGKRLLHCDSELFSANFDSSAEKLDAEEVKLSKIRELPAPVYRNLLLVNWVCFSVKANPKKPKNIGFWHTFGTADWGEPFDHP
jgi:hypothetical protein